MPRIQREVLIVIGAGILINSVVWLIAVPFSAQHPETTVLHYNIDVGVDLVGESKQIITLPITGGVILLVNSILGILLYRADKRTAWILWSIIPLAQIILVGAVALLWRINV